MSADGGSFRDPSGRVYRLDETEGSRIVRGLTEEAASTIDRLLSEPFFRNLVAAGDVVQTTSLSHQDSATSRMVEMGWRSAVEHEPVEFITWPYEWPFSMLKDAALLQLRLLDASVRNGWIMKDATPYNIQWKGNRPVFIDVPSFVPFEDGDYWQGYRQFCSTFLTPLLLTAHLGIPFQPLLRSRLEGIPPDEAIRYFQGWKRFKRGVLSHVWFPAKAERRILSRGAPSKPVASKRGQPRTMLLALIDSLMRLVNRLSYGHSGSDWSQYSETHTYSENDFQRKRNFIDRHASALRPRLLWDLGANTGVFSRVAAQHSDIVVAVDGDHDAVDMLYQDTLEAGEQNIIPLMLDIANLSPSQGWAGRERAAFDRRRSPDMVLCLALIHHMRVSANIPLALFVEWLRSLDATAIVEFVDRDDEMFLTLIKERALEYEDYTAEHFQMEILRYFNIRDRLQLMDGKREILLIEPKA